MQLFKQLIDCPIISLKSEKNYISEKTQRAHKLCELIIYAEI